MEDYILRARLLLTFSILVFFCFFLSQIFFPPKYIFALCAMSLFMCVYSCQVVYCVNRQIKISEEMALPALTLPPPRLYLSSCPPSDFSPSDPHLLLWSKRKQTSTTLRAILRMLQKFLEKQTHFDRLLQSSVVMQTQRNEVGPMLKEVQLTLKFSWSNLGYFLSYL